ncbi:MAG: hypothetical protein K6E78_09115 [Treponema sp.]|nr:hypothetical protein [Treponema sp.]
MTTAVIYCWNKTEDKVKRNYDETLSENFRKSALKYYEFISIKGKNFEIGKTEVTQKFYESVMGLNPSNHKGENQKKCLWRKLGQVRTDSFIRQVV